VEDGTRFWELGAGYYVRTTSSELQAPGAIPENEQVDNVFNIENYLIKAKEIFVL
jgi:hypothetical protein